MRRKRILCQFDGEEQVVFGTIRYEPGREPDDSIAVIHEEGYEEDELRLSEWAVLEVTDDNRQPV